MAILSTELRATLMENEAGRSLMDALNSLAKRTGVQELTLLVSLMVQTDRFGTPMVETLRGQAESMRYTRMQLAEEAAQKAPVRMMFPAAMIFFAVLMILGGPAVLLLMDFLNGPA